MSLPFALLRLKCSAAPRTGKTRRQRDARVRPTNSDSASSPSNMDYNCAKGQGIAGQGKVRPSDAASKKQGRERLPKVCGQPLAASTRANWCQTGTEKVLTSAAATATPYRRRPGGK